MTYGYVDDFMAVSFLLFTAIRAKISYDISSDTKMKEKLDLPLFEQPTYPGNILLRGVIK